jgi:hypothetical protein
MKFSRGLERLVLARDGMAKAWQLEPSNPY